MRKFTVVATLIALAIVIGFVTWFVASSKVTNSHSIYGRFNYTLPEQSLPSKQTTNLKQTAWIPDWGFSAGFKTLQANAASFDSVSPVWYYLEKDGKLKVNKVGLVELQKFCQANKIKLIPSIANFNASEFTIILSDKAKLDEHIQFLKSEVTKHNFDGFDLDYESIYLADQSAFFYLVSELSSFLRAQNKALTMAVLSQWTTDQAYTSLTQTRKVQNLALLEPYIDEFRIMSYDYTSPGSSSAGPVAPLDWQEAILRFATRTLPASKIMIGSNLYAYVWEDRTPHASPYLSYLEQTNEGAKPVFTLTMEQIAERVRRKGAQSLKDPGAGELILSYPSEGKRYIAYAPSTNTNLARASLAKLYGIKGIAYWRLGNEDYAIFKL